MFGQSFHECDEPRKLGVVVAFPESCPFQYLTFCATSLDTPSMCDGEEDPGRLGPEWDCMPSLVTRLEKS